MRSDSGRVYTFSVQVNDQSVQQATRLPNGANGSGAVWMFTLEPNQTITHRIYILCSSSIGRGPGASTIEDRELRWFHIDYWPQ